MHHRPNLCEHLPVSVEWHTREQMMDRVMVLEQPQTANDRINFLGKNEGCGIAIPACCGVLVMNNPGEEDKRYEDAEQFAKTNRTAAA